MMTLFTQVNRPGRDEALIWIGSTPREAMTAEEWFPRSSHNGPRGLQVNRLDLPVVGKSPSAP
jgi:hypothetical protein